MLKKLFLLLFCATAAFALSAAGLEFVPLTSCRVLDTRGDQPHKGGFPRIVPITSSPCSVPSTAAAYSFNVTAFPLVGTLAYLTAWPDGESQPNVSTLNSPDGAVVSNAAIVPAGNTGAVDLFVTHDADVTLDINGYFIAPGKDTLKFSPVAPCRILDTRGPTGPSGAPFLAANVSRVVPIASAPCPTRLIAKAYALNITVVPKGALHSLFVYPSDQASPKLATLSSLDGTVRAVAAIVAASAVDASISVLSTDDTDVVVDITGRFDVAGYQFYPLTPCRAADTRLATGPLGGPSLAAGTTRSLPLASGACGIPTDAGALSLNLTVAPPGFLGYLTAWGTGFGMPATSTLNDPKGIVVANAAFTRAGANGSIDVFPMNPTDLVVDVNGYFK